MDAYTGWAGLTSGGVLAASGADLATVFLGTRRGQLLCKLKMAARPKLALERTPETIKLNLKTESAQNGVLGYKFRR